MAIVIELLYQKVLVEEKIVAGIELKQVEDTDCFWDWAAAVEDCDCWAVAGEDCDCFWDWTAVVEDIGWGGTLWSWAIISRILAENKMTKVKQYIHKIYTN